MDIRYVDDPRGLETLATAVATADRIALDCEAAGYHRYSDRLCLLQLTMGTRTFLVDPFAVDPEPVLRPALEDPGIEVLMHGADFDVRLLSRDLEIGISGLFDTQIAASLLGADAIGLSSLLERRLGVKLSKKFQKADWAQRPLSEPMRIYAAHDTVHLPALGDELLQELTQQGRLEWAREEFRELEKVRFDGESAGDPVLRIRAARELHPREVDRLREGLEWRDRIARDLDRALFRVVGDPVLVEIARLNPRSVQELERVRGLNATLARQRGPELLDRLRAVELRPDEGIRGYPRMQRQRNGSGRPPPEVEERFTRLKAVRNARAVELGVERGTLLPNAVLQLLAESPPEDAAQLVRTEGMRNWQADLLGEALLNAL